MAQYQERPGRADFCDKNDHDGAVHRCLHGIMHLVEDHAKAAGIPLRFAASKLVEGDPLILEALHLSQNEKEMLEHIICQMEEERGLDRAAAIADMRFAFIQKLCAQTVVRPRESREHERSRRIDAVLTGKYTAIPAFVGIMAPGVLPHLQRHRRLAPGAAGDGHRRPDGGGGRSPHRLGTSTMCSTP